MYRLRLRKNRYDVYDIYKDDERVKDKSDFCICINEEKHSVAFYNAYTIHELLDINIMLDDIVGILMMIDDTNKWRVDSRYDFYQINKTLEIKLNNI